MRAIRPKPVSRTESTSTKTLSLIPSFLFTPADLPCTFSRALLPHATVMTFCWRLCKEGNLLAVRIAAFTETDDIPVTRSSCVKPAATPIKVRLKKSLLSSTLLRNVLNRYTPAEAGALRCLPWHARFLGVCSLNPTHARFATTAAHSP